MSEQPTLGPWTNKEYGTFVYSKHGNVCACGDPHASSVVGYTECNIGSDSLSEAVANARLIAAAPDLFKALKAFLDAGDGHDDFEDEWPAARAAIAKAITGKQ